MLRRLQQAETLLALWVAWALTFFVPFRISSALVGRLGPANREDVTPAEGASMRARAVALRIVYLAPRFGGRATCLVRALAGRILLMRRGVPSTIRFGVRKGPSGLEAHAWLIVNGEILLGGEGAADYVPLADIGARGQTGMRQ
jgi:hypothetical protein